MQNMKMIIDRKRYDTHHARLLTSRGNGCARSDGHFLEESLYRTEAGSWFLHGSGGPATQYAAVSADGNHRYYNETIVPLTEDQAADWLGRHHPGLFEEYFSRFARNA
jgi:hypothetical protein